MSSARFAALRARLILHARRRELALPEGDEMSLRFGADDEDAERSSDCREQGAEATRGILVFLGMQTAGGSRLMKGEG